MRLTSLRRGMAGVALWLALHGATADTASASRSSHDSLPIFGWLEWSYLEPLHVRLKAKLDSGAKTSSLSAIDIERIERDGVSWMRFHVPISANDGGTALAQSIAMELPLQREVLIKRHGERAARRSVVEIGVCLGGAVFLTPVTLTDRSHFNYPLLLGRSALRGRALLDVSHIHQNDADGAQCASNAQHLKD